jgi:hypothetical protein
MTDEERKFIEMENYQLVLLRYLEDMEFAAHNAKTHAYERRWQRVRVHLLALGKMVRDCAEFTNRLEHYDSNRPPSTG